jgi:hypothetical protein
MLAATAGRYARRRRVFVCLCLCLRVARAITGWCVFMCACVQEDPSATSRLAEKVLLQNSHTTTLMATLRTFLSLFAGAEHLFAPVLEVLHASCLVPYIQSCLRTSEMDMLANIELYRSVRAVLPRAAARRVAAVGLGHVFGLPARRCMS